MPSALWGVAVGRHWTTQHVFPIQDAIAHNCLDTDCVCGPTLERVTDTDPPITLVTHHSLDGRERYEGA